MTFVLNSSLQVQLPQLIKKVSEITPDDVPESIRKCLSKQNDKESQREMLQELLHLLSAEIKKYVDGAFAQDWPFLPPTINPTIMNEQNQQIPKLNQVELLLLSLNFALESEEYRMALSIAFVVDRFVYWRDGSSALLNIVDQIQKSAPSIPVAPQLVIRKARVMKDNGDLHGSIQVLDSLTEQRWDPTSLENCASNWQYKAEHQYINVCAVCVQIKGQIYHNLGLWKEAISPLMESLQGFHMLPEVDFKGTSYSYSLLSRCLCRLSKREYRELRQEFSFQFDHHCYEAYEFGMMAYKQSPRQRLFLSKHLLQSGECLLMYAVQLTDGRLQYKMFLEIMKILNLVFYNQNPEEFSQSKDQLFIFIKALFVTCLTLGCSYNPIDRDMGNYLEMICLLVYGKFCDIGANQLDSEIGMTNLKEIIPALNSALTRLSRDNLKFLSMAAAADDQNNLIGSLAKDIAGDLKHLTEGSKVQGSMEVECIQRTQFNEMKSEYDEHSIDATGRKVPLPVISKTDEKKLQRLRKMTFGNEVTINTIVDCETDTKESGVMSPQNISMVDCEEHVEKRRGTRRERVPMVDCRADTQERQEMTSIVDCEAETKERLASPGEKTSKGDCEAETKERLASPGEKTSKVDCEAETKERLASPGEKSSKVDCEAETKERLASPSEKTSKVDCEAETKERLASAGEKTSKVDCDAETKERLASAGEKTSKVDCDAETKERLESPGEKTSKVDCEAETKERLASPGEKSSKVNCEAETKERLASPSEKTSKVDCDAETKERLASAGEKSSKVDCEAETKERLASAGEKTSKVDCDAETKERLASPGEKTSKVDCEAETKERLASAGEKTSKVDCEAETKERLASAGEKTSKVDCDAETKERLASPSEKTSKVDCEAETKERLASPSEKSSKVDCDTETKERLASPGEKSSKVDCDTETKERLASPGEKSSKVDCEAETKERLASPGEKTSKVDCDAETKERLASPGEKSSKVDCEAETKERLASPSEKTSKVDFEAETKERLASPGEKSSKVDCEAETKERLASPGEKSSKVDCEAETKERLANPGEKTSKVDCEAETKERLASPGERTSKVDSEAVTKEHIASFTERILVVDCQKNPQERVEISSDKIPMRDFMVCNQGTVSSGASINVMRNSTFDSGFESFQSSLLSESHNSVLRPRIVGLPSHVSDIESKVLQLDKLHRNVDDFIQETYSSATADINASLVNTTALTAIRHSRKDGTYMRNRLLNKFQRQESLTEEPLVNISRADDVYQESLSSFIGKLLQEHLKPNILSSETCFHLPISKLNVDSANQNETINKIQKATLYQYNPVTYEWSGQDTIVCTGKELTLGKGKKGSFRNVYQITFLHQDEPLGKYVSKRYRDQREPLQYMDDVVSQMQAGLYVNHFNQELRAFKSDLRIHFLTAAYMLLYDSEGKVEDWMNIEPFVDGEFLKLTNNYDFCEPRGKKVSTSFTHFSYVKSGGKLMVSDLQGWLPTGTQNLIYLTDPQFHTDSGDSSPFDFGQDGMKVFFDVVHPQCNEICTTLKLERPTL